MGEEVRKKKSLRSLLPASPPPCESLWGSNEFEFSFKGLEQKNRNGEEYHG